MLLTGLALSSLASNLLLGAAAAPLIVNDTQHQCGDAERLSVIQLHNYALLEGNEVAIHAVSFAPDTSYQIRAIADTQTGPASMGDIKQAGAVGAPQAAALMTQYTPHAGQVEQVRPPLTLRLTGPEQEYEHYFETWYNDGSVEKRFGVFVDANFTKEECTISAARVFLWDLLRFDPKMPNRVNNTIAGHDRDGAIPSQTGENVGDDNDEPEGFEDGEGEDEEWEKDDSD